MTASSLSSEESLLHSPFPPYVMPISKILSDGDVNVEHGLSDPQCQKRQRVFGSNELAAPPTTPGWRRWLAQFEELVMWILIAAAIIAGVMGEWVESAALLPSVFVNGIIGFLQEQKAGRALAELQKFTSPIAKVTRDSLPQTIPARELVPGDIIELDAGDNIPADPRLLQAFGMRVQEAALTVESEPVDKDANCQLSEGTSLGDRCNMAYVGTVMAAGRASAPGPVHEAVITWKHGLLILLHGTLIATVAALSFWIIYQGDEARVDHARTVTFCVTAFAQLFFAISCRSQRFTIPEFGPLSNPQLFGAIIISALLPVTVVTLPFARPVFEIPVQLAWEWLLVGGAGPDPSHND